MFRVKIHHHIQLMISFFYRIGIWYHDGEDTVEKRKAERCKLIYSVCYSLFPISLAVGSLEPTISKDQRILLIKLSVETTILLLKLLFVIWKKDEILVTLNRFCDYCIDDPETFTLIDGKLNFSMKFAAMFLAATTFVGIAVALIVPLFNASDRKLFFQIAFPLDWRHSEFAYWMACTFCLVQLILSQIAIMFSILTWYLMANCSCRYEVLGEQMKRIGETEVIDGKKMHGDGLYIRNLLRSITLHQSLTELTNQLSAFLSGIFLCEMTTSSFCICTSIYSLASDTSGDSIERLIYLIGLLYCIFDIFMIMFFGNEITLASDRLSYHLYESDWIGRSKSIKQNVIVFGEHLIKPHQLTILKLYPISLTSFTRILNSAYSMFNILQSFK